MAEDGDGGGGAGVGTVRRQDHRPSFARSRRLPADCTRCRGRLVAAQFSDVSVLLAEDVHHKLTCLNVAEEFCAVKDLPAFNRLYFATPASGHGSSVQFHHFVSLAAWLLGLCRRPFTLEKVGAAAATCALATSHAARRVAALACALADGGPDLAADAAGCRGEGLGHRRLHHSLRRHERAAHLQRAEDAQRVGAGWRWQ